MTYEIHVKFNSEISTKNLATMMQDVYDENAVAGLFFIDGNPPAERMIRFQREALDDGDYIKERIPYGSEITDAVLLKAAGEQLIAELTAYTPNKYSLENLTPIFGRMQNGEFTMVGAQVLKEAVTEARKEVSEDFLAISHGSQTAP